MYIGVQNLFLKNMTSLHNLTSSVLKKITSFSLKKKKKNEKKKKKKKKKIEINISLENF